MGTYHGMLFIATCSISLPVNLFVMQKILCLHLHSLTISYSSLYLLFCHPLQGEGTLLATGSYDGQARIWSRDGE
jgi:hypothetical protein